ncbi:MAG: hypothetical protein K0R47_5948 [Brevibacillus sp.]|nr:hypothetical protein [Brevibacillus sp.]
MHSGMYLYVEKTGCLLHQEMSICMYLLLAQTVFDGRARKCLMSKMPHKLVKLTGHSLNFHIVTIQHFI